ncbi:hypothetical protein D3273_26275 [Lichenibacterium minor]|uniref:Uncharacterized protein n=1 Tax=Lichenibacterium minor TaxID=2316528 RepID=A0A4Q2TY47_9HYPH|nr:hypothetical protein [Lichenibacterium minor]RYC29003.1 hypothetical protein D3273_26275 [Lichenibacterium minor]
MPARSTLLALLAFFILGNVECATAPENDWLMTGNIITADTFDAGPAIDIDSNSVEKAKPWSTI